MLIVMQDISDAGFCGFGARRWFEAYDLDFKDFLANGIDSDVLLATGDALAERVVAMRQAKESAGG